LKQHGELPVIAREVLVLDTAGLSLEQLQPLSRESLNFVPARSVEEAARLFRSRHFSVALVVFDGEPESGLRAIESLVSGPASAEWIALIEPRALQSRDFRTFILRAFADYHTLPIDPQRLAVTIGHCIGKASLRQELESGKPESTGKFHIGGRSPVMQLLFQKMEKVIGSDAPVLIGGETGTGKELVAHAIHQHSARAGGPLVVVNCGAIPATLIQSELFGHEKSAFTGATQRKIGRIEAASGGVLFLDEIGDLPLDMQVSLLRVLQERTISRVGATQCIPVDFRVIAATHIDLNEAVAQGRFREDLYFRLNVLSLTVPALRERGDDIVLLAESLFTQFAARHGNGNARGLSRDALDALMRHDWPGNVRELINRIQRAVVMSENRLVSPADLGLDVARRSITTLTLDDARNSFERDLLETRLRANGNKVSQTARQLGVSRVTLYRMINKLNIALDH
jgi:DNA-binding NtrC family response regulator